MKNEKEEIEIDLGQIIQVLLSKIWVIFAIAILFGGLFFAGTYFLVTPLYQSDVKIYVNNSDISLGDVGVSMTSGDISASQSLVETYIVILNTRTTLNEVIAQANLPYTYLQLGEMIEASPVNGTEIFEIVVTSPEPKEASLIADTIANILPMKIDEIIEDTSSRVVDTSIVSTLPSSPNITVNTIIGALLGVIICSVVIVIKHMMNQEITSEEDLIAICDLPILSVVPAENTSHSGNSYEYKHRDKSGNKKSKKNSKVTNNKINEQKYTQNNSKKNSSKSVKNNNLKLSDKEAKIRDVERNVRERSRY